jgi:hypothetical protein
MGPGGRWQPLLAVEGRITLAASMRVRIPATQSHGAETAGSRHHRSMPSIEKARPQGLLSRSPHAIRRVISLKTVDWFESLPSNIGRARRRAEGRSFQHACRIHHLPPMAIAGDDIAVRLSLLRPPARMESSSAPRRKISPRRCPPARHLLADAIARGHGLPCVSATFREVIQSDSACRNLSSVRRA